MVPVSDNFVGATFDIVYGRQWIFGNSITVGWYVGLGYVAESKTFSGSGQDLDTGGRYAFDTYNNSPSSNNKIPIMATF